MADDSYAWIDAKRNNFLRFIKQTQAYGQLSFAQKTVLETFWTAPIEELIDDYVTSGPNWRLDEHEFIHLQLQNKAWLSQPHEVMRAGEFYEHIHAFWLQLNPDEQTLYERYLACFAGFLFKLEESFKPKPEQP